MSIKIETEKIISLPDNIRMRKIISYEIDMFSELPHNYVKTGNHAYVSVRTDGWGTWKLHTDETATAILFAKIASASKPMYSLSISPYDVIRDDYFQELLKFIKRCKHRLQAIKEAEQQDAVSQERWKGSETFII